jgi:pimeloyl-ACP methyl ester carboxylesterase
MVDPSRSTPARGTVPATAGRVLVTDLRIPVGEPGPLPLVVFAHGWNSNPSVYEALLDTWAEAGYLVAAPVFPDSTDLYAGSPVSNYSDQARDISFVITSLLHDGVAQIDPLRIAVAGHSDGGTDVALLALDPAYADDRIRAYLCLAGEMPSGVDPYSIGSPPGSLLVAVGTADEYGLFPLATTVFVSAAMPKVMVTELGGDHLGSFVSGSPAAASMRQETVTFLQLTMGPGTPTSDGLATALVPTLSPEVTVSP